MILSFRRAFTGLVGFCLFGLTFISCQVKNKMYEADRKFPEKKWNLVWSDEFDNEGAPDSSKWSYSARSKADWACFCSDDPEVALVREGSLILRGMVSKTANDTARYKTGCIQTRNKFSFRYGKIEVRAKFKSGKGSWPAIWMMPVNSSYGEWPYSGEIDIMEQLNRDSIVYQTLHSAYIDIEGNKDKPRYFNTVPYKVGEYNVFGIEWYDDKLDFFINGRKTFTYPKISGAGKKQWPFDKKFYIILDQALGGNWVGRIEDKDLPVEMMVDWVRVFKE